MNNYTFYFILLFCSLLTISFAQKADEDKAMLITLSEKKYDYEGDGYCGCWDIETVGQYGIKKNKNYLSLGQLRFCASHELLDKKLHFLNTKKGQVYLIYQYGTCNSVVAYAYGFDKESNVFFSYSFVYKNGSSREEVYTSSHLIVENNKLKTQFYGAENGSTYRFWKVDTKQQQIIELEK